MVETLQKEGDKSFSFRDMFCYPYTFDKPKKKTDGNDLTLTSVTQENYCINGDTLGTMTVEIANTACANVTKEVFSRTMCLMNHPLVWGDSSTNWSDLLHYDDVINDNVSLKRFLEERELSLSFIQDNKEFEENLLELQLFFSTCNIVSLSFIEGNHRMVISTRPLYGFPLCDNTPLKFVPKKAHSAVELFEKRVARVKKNSPVHKTVKCVVILPKQRVGPDIQHEELRKISTDIQEKLNMAIKSGYLEFFSSTKNEIDAVFRKHKVTLCNATQFLRGSVSNKHDFFLLNQMKVKVHLNKCVHDCFWSKEPTKDLIPGKKDNLRHELEPNLDEKKRKVFAFWTNNWGYETVFWLPLKDESNALSAGAIAEKNCGNNCYNGTWRKRSVPVMELVTIFEFFNAFHINEQMAPLYGRLFVTIDEQEDRFHPGWLLFYVLMPCYQLSNFLADKYFDEFAAKDNTKAKRPQSTSRARTRLKIAMRCALLEQAIGFIEKYKSNEYLDHFSNLKFAKKLVDTHKQEYENIVNTKGKKQGVPEMMKHTMAKSDGDAFLLFYPTYVFEMFNNKGIKSSFFRKIGVTYSDESIAFKKPKSREWLDSQPQRFLTVDDFLPETATMEFLLEQGKDKPSNISSAFLDDLVKTVEQDAREQNTRGKRKFASPEKAMKKQKLSNAELMQAVLAGNVDISQLVGEQGTEEKNDETNETDIPKDKVTDDNDQTEEKDQVQQKDNQDAQQQDNQDQQQENQELKSLPAPTYFNIPISDKFLGKAVLLYGTLAYVINELDKQPEPNLHEPRYITLVNAARKKLIARLITYNNMIHAEMEKIEPDSGSFESQATESFLSAYIACLEARLAIGKEYSWSGLSKGSIWLGFLRAFIHLDVLYLDKRMNALHYPTTIPHVSLLKGARLPNQYQSLYKKGITQDFENMRIWYEENKVVCNLTCKESKHQGQTLDLNILANANLFDIDEAGEIWVVKASSDTKPDKSTLNDAKEKGNDEKQSNSSSSSSGSSSSNSSSSSSGSSSSSSDAESDDKINQKTTNTNDKSETDSSKPNKKEKADEDKEESKPENENKDGTNDEETTKDKDAPSKNKNPTGKAGRGGKGERTVRSGRGGRGGRGKKDTKKTTESPVKNNTEDKSPTNSPPQRHSPRLSKKK